MIHTTSTGHYGQFAVTDSDGPLAGRTLYFTYDPAWDGHFYAAMEHADPTFTRALVRSSSGDCRVVAVGDSNDAELNEIADTVVDTVVDAEALLRDLFTNKPERHTVVYIDEPKRVVLQRTTAKTPVETVVASEVNRGLLAALLAQDPKDTGVSIVMVGHERAHPSAHRIAKRHLVDARERYGYAYTAHISRGYISVPGEKEPHWIRLTGPYEGMGAVRRW